MAESGRFRDALAKRDARLLVSAFVVDALGGWAYFAVLLVEVHHRTGSSLMVALATTAGWVPRLVLSSYGGLLADRHDKVAVMRWSALSAGVIMSSLTVVVQVEGPVWLILALISLTAVTLCPYWPAASAMRASVVDEKDLVAINALFGLLESVVVVAGPLLGAALLALGSTTVAFGINALSFFAAAAIVSLISVRSPVHVPDESESFLKELSAGMVAIWREPVARALTIMIALDSSIYGASTVIYLPLGRQVGVGEDGLGTLLAFAALGGALFAVGANRLAASARLAPLVTGGLVVMTVSFAAAGWTGRLWVALLLQVGFGGGMVLVDVLGITALQRDVAGEVLGRVMGAMETLALSGILLGSLAVVPLLNAGGVKLAMTGLVVAVAIGTVLGVRPLVRADRANAAQVALLRPRVELLEALDLLSSAPRSLLERLAATVQVIIAEPGATLMRQGEAADFLWIVVSGSVGVTSVDPFGHERVRIDLGAHSYVGEIGLLHQVPRTATVTVTTPSELWRIPAEDFRNALAEVGSSTSLRSVSFSRVRQIRALPLPAPRVPVEVDEDAYNSL
jgi:hypothetical protein